MFTGSRSFERLAFFIDAYRMGFVDGGAVAEDQLAFSEFGCWLRDERCENMDMPGNRTWSFYTQVLYPNDDEALRQLPILYEQFLNAQADKEP